MKQAKMPQVIYSSDDGWTITKRELIASISILVFFFVAGAMLYGILDKQANDANDIYRKAITITDSQNMKYGIETGIGNAFVGGELSSIDPVTYKGTEYMSLKIVKQKYTKHIRKSGKNTIITHSWDTINTSYSSCNYVNFLGIKFLYKNIDGLVYREIETVKESYTIRYIYYGIPKAIKCSSFVSLNKDIVNKNIYFHENVDVNALRRICLNDGKVTKICFVIGWIVLTSFAVFMFYRIDNNWLED